MTEKPKILPCPFGCETEPELVEKSGYTFVKCQYCGAEAGHTFKDAEYSIDMWNTRPVETALEKKLEAMAEKAWGLLTADRFSQDEIDKAENEINQILSGVEK